MGFATRAPVFALANFYAAGVNLLFSFSSRKVRLSIVSPKTFDLRYFDFLFLLRVPHDHEFAIGFMLQAKSNFVQHGLAFVVDARKLLCILELTIADQAFADYGDRRRERFYVGGRHAGSALAVHVGDIDRYIQWSRWSVAGIQNGRG